MNIAEVYMIGSKEVEMSNVATGHECLRRMAGIRSISIKRVDFLH